MEQNQPRFTTAQKLTFIFGLIAFCATGYVFYKAWFHNFTDWELYISSVDFILSAITSLISIIGTMVNFRQARNEPRPTNVIQINNQIEISNQIEPLLVDAVDPDFADPKNYVPPEPEVFWDRVKTLFELKSYRQYQDFGNLDEQDCITGRYYTDNGDYIVVVRCDDRNVPLTPQDISDFEQHAKSIHRHQREQGLKLKMIYVVEEGDLAQSLEEKHLRDIELKTEDDLINEFIRFDPYLRKLCNRYFVDKLPYSNLPRERQKNLSEVYILPRFTLNDGQYEGSLDSYIDTWLSESSARHLAILADYGMGKSSYVKHLAAHLAQKWLAGDQTGRIPILIELGGESPRTDNNATGLLSKFNDKNRLGTTTQALRYLMRRGRLLVLLDGFDEMDLIGDHDQRRQHFETLWTLAEHHNKIIISGRSGYFPNEAELQKTLAVADRSHKGGTGARYCTRINLAPFTQPDIQNVFEKYFGSDSATHYQIVADQPQLLTLAERPALLHIILDHLANRSSPDSPFNLSDTIGEVRPAYLLRAYTDHWLIREVERDRILLVEDEDRRRFSIELATYLYTNDKVEITANELFDLYSEWFPQNAEKQQNHQIREGIKTDLRTCTFVIPTGNDTFKFAHMPFLEYFVAEKIASYLRNEEPLPKILCSIEWRHEICRHVADLLFEKGLDHKQIAMAFDRSAIQESGLFFKRKKSSQARPSFEFEAMSHNSTQVEIYSGAKYEDTHKGIQLFKTHKRSKRNKSNPFVNFEIQLAPFLRHLDLKGANLAGANLAGAHLFGANLAGANLAGAHLFGANLAEANLEGVNLERTNLAGAHLFGANLIGANLKRANLRSANLHSANLYNANLYRAILYRANLERAILYRANLERANLEIANLAGAQLFGANLEGANLEGANLIGANLGPGFDTRVVLYNQRTVWP